MIAAVSAGRCGVRPGRQSQIDDTDALERLGTEGSVFSRTVVQAEA